MPNTTPSTMPPPCDAAFQISSRLVYFIIVCSYNSLWCCKDKNFFLKHLNYFDIFNFFLHSFKENRLLYPIFPAVVDIDAFVQSTEATALKVVNTSACTSHTSLTRLFYIIDVSRGFVAQAE